jgi:23S rRNA (cytosine1962-C5)-methyltransferase
MTHSISGYTLLDSGAGRKLERFGDRVLDRPSSLSSWRTRRADSIWHQANARYLPPDSWERASKVPMQWIAQIAGVQMELELMSNGQVGLFPEHALYLPLIRSTIASLASQLRRPIRVLNLFAYTGLATSYCAALPDVQVTHVDLAKRAIEWAKRNAGLNKIRPESIRWIVDDALGYMAREHRKGSLYDLVIIDPPSFSRVSKNNSWTLDEKVAEIVTLVLDVLNLEAGAMFFTHHSSASTSDVARNIALDRFSDHNVAISIEALAINEESSPRRLPAGSLVVLSHGLNQ